MNEKKSSLKIAPLDWIELSDDRKFVIYREYCEMSWAYDIPKLHQMLCDQYHISPEQLLVVLNECRVRVKVMQVMLKGSL